MESMGIGYLFNVTMIVNTMETGMQARTRYQPAAGPQEMSRTRIPAALVVELVSESTNLRQGPVMQLGMSSAKALVIPVQAKKAMTTESTIKMPDTTMMLRKRVAPMVKMSLSRKLAKKFKVRTIANKAETIKATRVKAWDSFTMLKRAEPST